MEYLKINNWEKTQHYKTRRPPWIRLYTDIIEKYDQDGKPKKFYNLPDDAKLTFITLLCASSKFHNNIPFENPRELASILAITENSINLGPLIKAEYIQIINDASIDASKDASGKFCDRATESETETESETDNEGYALPDQEIINNASEPKIIEEIDKLAEFLYQEKIFPKCHAFKNTMLKKVRNPRAVLYCLIAVHTFKPKDPWAYAEKIIQKENGNFNEREYRKTEK